MLKHRVAFPLVVAIFALATSGCANLNSISRRTSIKSTDKAMIVTVDAKQRHLYLTPNLENGKVVDWRICAEAAPDVFSALASSGSLKVDLSQQPSGEAGFSMAETAATIQRSQSINLIRESFYRTCERFASGAMTRGQFIVQSARDQRAMVSILAIEQLTGAVRPAATVIMGPGTQASVLSGQESAALVKDYRERRDTAEAAYGAAKTAYDTAQKSGGVCADGDAKDEVKCAELKLASDNAKKTFEDAQGGLDNAMAVAKSLTDSASSSTLGGTNATSGITQADINSANLAAVADAVVRIQQGANVNEPLMFCMAFLTEGAASGLDRLDDSSKQRIVNTCLGILSDQAKADRDFVTSQVSFQPGGAEKALAKYLDPSLTDAEHKRRTDLALQAMRSVKVGESSADFLRIIAQGPDAVRGLILEQLRKTETNATAKAALD